MTRIVAGSAKGRILKVPAQGTRPTSAKVREALFSKLEHWDVVADSRVLDLFAGSGALGIEALSRGARSVVFVDSSRAAIDVVKDNLKALKLSGHARCIPVSASRYLDTSTECFDVVFIDPPYALTETDLLAILELIRDRLEPDGVIIVERDGRSPEPMLPDGLVCEEHRRWGDTAAWFVGAA